MVRETYANKEDEILLIDISLLFQEVKYESAEFVENKEDSNGIDTKCY